MYGKKCVQESDSHAPPVWRSELWWSPCMWLKRSVLLLGERLLPLFTILQLQANGPTLLMTLNSTRPTYRNMLEANFGWGSLEKKKRIVEKCAFILQQSHLHVLWWQMCFKSSCFCADHRALHAFVVTFALAESACTASVNKERRSCSSLNVYLLFRTHLLAFIPPWHVTRRVKGEAGYFSGTLSIPLCSRGIHLSITQNPMSGLRWLLRTGHSLL